MTKPATRATEAEATRAAMTVHTTARYLMRLYIVGSTLNSTQAIVNIRKICEEHLGGKYDLEIIDITQHPALAAGAQILAAPTLIRLSPLPERRFIGDMSRTDCILHGLDIRSAPANPPGRT